MNPSLLHALNQLAQETREFLADAEPDLARWEFYMARRTAIFAELQSVECSAAELADPTIAALKDEIFRQESQVQAQARAKLAGLGAAIRMLETGRQALHGYGVASSSALFERSI